MNSLQQALGRGKAFLAIQHMQLFAVAADTLHGTQRRPQLDDKRSSTNVPDPFPQQDNHREKRRPSRSPAPPCGQPTNPRRASSQRKFFPVSGHPFGLKCFVLFSVSIRPQKRSRPTRNLRRCGEGGEEAGGLHFCLQLGP
jgi:hypothetical protein